MISFDVEALFPSIPVADAINALKIHLDSCEIDNDKKQTYLDAAKVCMAHNFFQFKGKFYTIDLGTSMGNPLSPLIAEVFMANFEINLKQKGLLPRIWLRYVDDVFAVIKANQINEILSVLNSEFESINFTYECEENNKLPFLDLLVTKVKNKFDFSIYRKSTSIDRYITSDSYCPMQHKSAAFHSMIHRLCKLPLSVSNYLNEYKHIKKVATLNGYKESMVDQLIKKHTHKIKKSSLSTLFTQQKYNENNNNFDRAVMTYVPEVTNKLKPKLRQKNIDCVFSNNGKIKNLLGTTKDKTDLKDKSGIYEVKCGDCGDRYIGQTKRSLGVRFTEHCSHIKFNRAEKSSVAAHALSRNHFDINFTNVRLLKNVTKASRLDAYESVYIHINDQLMNADSGNIVSSLFNLI